MTTNQRILLAIIFFVGIALRVYFLVNYELIDAKEHVTFLSDESIVGLMAKHIASGTNFPFFFYGQNYLGAFEAYVAAFLFGFFGISVLALKSVPAIFSVALLFVVYFLAKKLFNARVAVLSTLLVAIPSPYFFAWGLKARGGFIEHVVFSLLILLVFSLIYFHQKSSLWLYTLLGFLSGFGLWVNQLVLPCLAPLGILFWSKRAVLLTKSTLLILLLTFLLGASPLIVGNVHEPFGTVKNLFMKELRITRDSSTFDNRTKIEQLIYEIFTELKRLPSGTARNLSIIFGKEDTWKDDGLLPQTTKIKNLPPVPRFLWFVIPLFFGCALLSGCYRRFNAGTGRVKLCAFVKGMDQMDVLVLLFFASLLIYMWPRYLLVCYPLAAIVAAAFFHNLTRKYVKMLFAAMLLATISINTYGILDLAFNRRDDSITKLVNALEAKGCRYGYTAGSMYQIAFLSQEKAIFVPVDQWGRYPRYDLEVAKATNICYVFGPEQFRQKNHRAFTKLLEQQNIRYHKTTVNGDTDYHIYHSFEPREKIPATIRETIKLIRKALSESA